MINNNRQPQKRILNRGVVGSNKQKMPHLSLNLHTMPRSSEQHFYKWILWGGIILVILLLVAYILFS